MQTHHTLADWHAWRAGQAVAPIFVPTMGNLHDGHLALIRQAKALAQPHGAKVVASIFVNRLQFAPHEDFDSYPRTLARDAALLQEAGCDALLAPSEAELYPQPQGYKVVPPAALADILEGAFRPGFFTGVCTVVHKLFNIVGPQAAVFGKKDYQQLMVIRNMVSQMALPIAIHGGDTMRAGDGLALSSRNGYLSEDERAKAVALVHALRALQTRVQDALKTQYGALSADALADMQRQAMDGLQRQGWAPDYVEVRRQHDLATPEPADWQAVEPMVIVAAARLGHTRLIDNIEFTPPKVV